MTVRVPVVVHDGVEAVSNGEDGGISKLCADGLLDEVVSLQVHSCRCLVQHQDLGLAQQSSRQTHQLTLPDTALLQTRDIKQV